MGEVVEMSEPFFVGRNNPRFRYACGGYLPALEENVSDKVSVKESNIKVIYRFVQVPYKKKRTYKHYT